MRVNRADPPARTSRVSDGHWRSQPTTSLRIVWAILAPSAPAVVAAFICASIASASVAPSRGVLAAGDVPPTIKLIADQNAGAIAQRRVSASRPPRFTPWRYRADYSVQFLGLIHGSVVGIVSSVVLFRTPSGAHHLVTFTASACSSAGSAHFIREPSIASDACVCVTKRLSNGETLIAYRCVWSHHLIRDAVSVNVSGAPVRQPGMTAAQAKTMALRLAKIQIERNR